jgi:hypothetical protein
MNQETTQCSAESEPQVHSSAVFCVGERVSWTHVRTNGSSINFTTREGKVTEVGKRCCRVKTRHGKYQWVLFGDLTKDGETTQLTKMFKASTGDNAKPTPNTGAQRPATNDL